MAFMRFWVIIAIAAGLGSLLNPHTGHASEYPIFRAALEILNKPALYPVKNYVKNKLGSQEADNFIASSDLNYDGMPEYIVRSCPNNTGKKNCHFYILAFTTDKNEPIRPLGHMNGESLQISDKSDYGVRRLMVQDKELNDFAVTYYSWDTKQSHYTQHTAP